ncbi:putative DNA-binding protein (MmcQ/YjbR family) [Prosthecobacter fusiformis]|uniref:Putative DNA-binding protein (MmcQ/YjbR family) n=1 Tax=Prosthecobacter fusiformis TaxID=48464 RepID=A0A4R7RLG0_9BACT|nr:MmcQ/YjbR family DNA-binding protein [Prosthecobacter fusiformis]TDU64293.1 putative DNA-binding protein (MmcQ/YjbR family) [Prosthecobacter fusiformis]
MTLADFCAHCLSLPQVEETTPFGPDVLVYKVAGKMFALTTPDEYPPSANLKCDPERAIELRDRYEDIQPGYHMNKRHWNTLILESSLPTKLVKELIGHSYQLVVSGLPKKLRETLRSDSQ